MSAKISQRRYNRHIRPFDKGIDASRTRFKALRPTHAVICFFRLAKKSLGLPRDEEIAVLSIDLSTCSFQHDHI
jgi:hypothetical protein